jgi:hypothetical protein
MKTVPAILQKQIGKVVFHPVLVYEVPVLLSNAAIAYVSDLNKPDIADHQRETRPHLVRLV